MKMEKGLRKVILYLITFFTCIAVDILVIVITKATTIPFGEMFVSGIFMAIVVGTTAEHFTKKDKDGGENGA